MENHECVIGLIRVADDSEPTTVRGLQEHIAYRVSHNKEMKELGIVADWMFCKEWTIKDYTDKRKNTNLTRFDFCPECGKRIDWAAIRRGDG